MSEPYALTVEMLENRRTNLVSGIDGITDLEERLEKNKKDAESLAYRIASAKAECADITRSLELLKAGGSL
jgi:hypothetical protein